MRQENKSERGLAVFAVAAMAATIGLVFIRPVCFAAPPSSFPRFSAVSLPMERGNDLNNKGVVVGTDEAAHRLLVWKAGTTRVLANSPFFLTSTEMIGQYRETPTIHPDTITDAGRITGIVEYIWAGAITVGKDFPFVWEEGKLRRGSLSRAGRHYDQKGRKVGSEDTGSLTFPAIYGDIALHPSDETQNGRRYRHAVLYDPHGKGKDVGVLFGETWSNAVALNEKGEITGNSGRQAFLWQNGKMARLGVFLGTPAQTFSSSARDINAAGQIVGEAQIDSQAETLRKAFLWQNSQMILNKAVMALPPHVVLEDAAAINDPSYIVGSPGRIRKNLLFCFGLHIQMKPQINSEVLLLRLGEPTV